MLLLAVMLGGALGAACRYLSGLGITALLGTQALPVATLAVNVIGSFLLGLLIFSKFLGLPEAYKLALGTGFLGALTTFSTFQLELFQLSESAKWFTLWLYLLASLTLGFGAVLLGKRLAELS